MTTPKDVPLTPALEPILAGAHVHRPRLLIDRRIILISALSIALALLATWVALWLTRLIGFFTNLAFYQKLDPSFASPADNHLGLFVVIVPVIGGLLVGLLARFGSAAIRGHGIPEAMEQVLTNKSRIPARVTWLKPLSAAISIGTGGPFGAEGPIIASGAALGSLLGQVLEVSAVERKTLLAAGAAAGMAATFGSPLSAVLLAVELLLFEYRPRSLIPVALAASVASAARAQLIGSAPVFRTAPLMAATSSALFAYLVLGLLVGVAAIGVTRACYAVEDRFERLPIHWMWWPALGAIAVGVVGYFAPHSLGVGYDNIEAIVSGTLVGSALFRLCLAKFVSWAVALGSGTSGGTLAPLLTIGGGIGALFGAVVGHAFPASAISPPMAAVVGMAALFAGASRAPLASLVFAFETTHQPAALLPLLIGCTASYLVSCLFMRHSIMTEKIERRGVRAPLEYASDELVQIGVREVCSTEVVTLAADETLLHVRQWLSSGAPGTHHQGFPVLDCERLIGVVTQRDLRRLHESTQCIGALVERPAVCAYDDMSLRDAVEIMARERIGRLPVVTRRHPLQVIGILTRSDVIEAYARR
ncbi:MAG TPA: chloride channel protein, partial [Polyangiales bacterium]|nr:chloride channel protein [Polyangiales bacterium]